MQATRFTWPKPRWTTWSLVRDERPRHGAAQSADAPPDSTQSCGASVDARTNARPDAVVRFDLIEGLAPDEVDRRIAHGRRAGDVGNRAVAYYLADCADRGLHQVLGHPGVVPYAVKRHAIPRRTARDLVAAGRALQDAATEAESLRPCDEGSPLRIPPARRDGSVCGSPLFSR